MSELDVLINEKIVPLRKKAVDALLQKHPHIFGMLDKYFAGKENKVGIRVTENGAPMADYTFHLKGLYIDRVENDVLDSELHHPFGIIKPYGVIEKKVLYKMVEDEEDLIKEPFSTAMKYLPDVTLKFLR